MNPADVSQSRCPNEGQWMAFFDGEGTMEIQENLGRHLRNCRDCQAVLASIGEHVMTINLALDDVQPPKNRRLDRWVPAAAAAILVMAVGFGIHTQGHKAMAALATLFQVKTIGTIPISPEQLAAVSNVISDGGHVTLNHYGSIKVAGPMQSELVPVKNLAVDGISNVWPSALGSVASATVQTGTRVSLTLNVGHINQLIVSEGGQDLFPKSLNGVPFTLTVPAEATFARGAWTVKEVPDPTLAVPGKVPTEAVVKALVHLPFLPSSLQADLAQMDNWKSRLVIPLPGHPENASIHGNSAIVESNAHSTEVGEAWVQGGTVVAVIEQQTHPINVQAFRAEVSRLFS